MNALRAACAAVLLMPALASAARYDPDSDRAVLRQTATASHGAIADAAALALEPEKAPAIAAGLDEGVRLARLAADAARALDAAAQLRAADMAAGVKDGALDRKLKELAEPIAAERLRWDRLAPEPEELKKKAEELPPEEKKKVLSLLAKASSSLQSADDALRPFEESVKLAGSQALEMKAAQKDSLRPLVEVSSAAAGMISRSDALPEAAAEAKARLSALGQEPRGVARSRAGEKLEAAREISRQLFENADTACNRVDDFRRRSAAYERAAGDYEKARLAASAGPAAAKAFLDEAQRALALAREHFKK